MIMNNLQFYWTENNPQVVCLSLRLAGIVRRIDELGRIVIPKELRRTMRIRDGEELEMNQVSDNEIIIKKLSV